MPGFRLSACTAAVLWGLVAVAAAQQPQSPPPQQSWWRRFKTDFHRNHMWPDPFIAVDRAAVNMPFVIMADNGWQRQNLLCEYHFSQENESELNQAGEAKLTWIATQTPSTRRVVFVQRGPSRQATAARIEAVQTSLGRIVQSGPLPRVQPSDMDSSVYDGSDVDATLRAADKSRPDPHIPEANPTAISN